jgi:DNA repair photolyase
MPQHIQSKTILNKTKKRDPWFLDDYTINPYSGCSFNCLYCYIRGSKYGEHMEEKLSIKTNAVELLEKQLALKAKKGQYGVIVLSSATDPYLQFEKEYELTRKLLEVILHYRFPVHIITKSDLVIRDFDLLKEIEKNAILPADLEGKVSQKSFITFSFNTLDDAVAKIFEPGATPPSLRLETFKKTIEAGFLSGVSMMPLIPYITDTTESIENMFSTFKNIGAHYVFPAPITLFGNGPGDSKTLMLKAVARYYPHLLEKYQNFFEVNTQMPTYYEYMFYKKMMDLCNKHDLHIMITKREFLGESHPLHKKE